MILCNFEICVPFDQTNIFTSYYTSIDADSDERKYTTDLLIQMQKTQMQILQHLRLSKPTSPPPECPPESLPAALPTTPLPQPDNPLDGSDLNNPDIPDNVLSEAWESLTNSVSESPVRLRLDSPALSLTPSLTPTPLSSPIEIADGSFSSGHLHVPPTPYSHYYQFRSIPDYPAPLPIHVQ